MVQLPFRRKQTPDLPVDPKIPKEVVDYYQAEQRERRGVTWLLGLATLVVTILVAFGLYYGGRWAYRQTIGDDQDTTKVTQAPTQNQPQTNQPSTSDNSDQTDDDSTTTTPQPSTTPDNTSAVGKPTETDMPSTGPGNIVAIFSATSGLAAGAHYLVTKYRRA